MYDCPFVQKKYFNPRSHERSDNFRKAPLAMVRLFQSTLPREERHCHKNAIQQTAISIHAPTRGATVSNLPAYSYVKISIHAPTRGATYVRLYCYVLLLFQSTLPREERRARTSYLQYGMQFQSTLPREERHSTDSLRLPVRGISIHAPTRGATATVPPSSPSSPISIHAPTRGATCAVPFQVPLSLVFQSTLPREERHSPVWCQRLACSYFNPRSHERSDGKCHSRSHKHFISIHAPTRGATLSASPSVPPRYFNPRSHERSDPQPIVKTAASSIFQSTLPREERL